MASMFRTGVVPGSDNATPTDPPRATPEGATVSATYDLVMDEPEATKFKNELSVVPTVSSVVSVEPEPVEFVSQEPLSDGSVRLRMPRFFGYDKFGIPPRRRRFLNEGCPIDGSVEFQGSLADATSQRQVFESIMNAWSGDDLRRHGVRITVPCGFGKTVIALASIAALGRRALVVAPNTILVEQWRERAEQFVPRARVETLRVGPGASSLTWLLPDTPADTAEELLRTTERRRTVSSEDFGRRISVRSGQVRGAEAPGRDDITVEFGDTWICVRSDAEGAPSAGVVISVWTRAPLYEQIEDTADGALIRCGDAKRARSALRKLGDVGKAAVPSHLLDPAMLPSGMCQERPVDICIATVQSLSMGELPTVALGSFGALVVDEVHSVCARVFSRAMRAVPCARILALSATPERRDGMHAALPWHCGPEIVRIHRTFERVDVDVLTYRDGSHKELRFHNGQLRVAQMVSELVDDNVRSARIASLAVHHRRAGREVIILGERVGHLRDLASRIEALTGEKCGVLCGETPQAERGAEARLPIILATYPLCRQGFDKPRLDTLIMATPVTAIEQCVGRILRAHPDKRPPLVVDIVDPFSLFMGEARKRRRQYDGWRYRIRDATLDDATN